jgi:hypothetical protein
MKRKASFTRIVAPLPGFLIRQTTFNPESSTVKAISPKTKIERGDRSSLFG